jgi:hypothetical protein
MYNGDKNRRRALLAVAVFLMLTAVVLVSTSIELFRKTNELAEAKWELENHSHPVIKPKRWKNEWEETPTCTTTRVYFDD